MKKFSIQSNTIIVNKEKQQITSFDDKGIKHILYCKVNNLASDNDLFQIMEFTEKLNITPKKKFSDMHFDIKINNDKKLNTLYHGENVVYFLKNNKNIIINNEDYKLILFDGKIFGQDTLKDNLKETDKNILVNDTEIQKINVLKSEEKKLDLIDSILNKSDKEKELQQKKLLEEQEKKQKEELEKKKKEELEEQKKKLLEEQEKKQKVELEKLEKQQKKLLEEQEKKQKEELEKLEKQQKKLLEEQERENKLLEEQKKQKEEKKEHEIKKNEINSEKINLEKIVNDFNSLFNEKENKDIAIKNNELKESKVIVQTILPPYGQPLKQTLVETNNSTLKTSSKIIPSKLPSESTKLVSKINNDNDNDNNNIPIHTEKILNNNHLEINNHNLLNSNDNIIGNHRVLSINYQNITYNLNTVNLESTPNLNFSNLYTTEISKNNIINNHLLTFNLETKNNSYLVNLLNQKYLINKINNSIVLTNLVSKNSQIIKNNDIFKIGNNDFLLYANSTLIIPVINKKIFDNRYGTSYNAFIPRVKN